MPIEGLSHATPLTPLPPLPPITPLTAQPVTGAQPAGTGFAAVFNNLLEGNRQANEAANDAVRDLATGEVQDLHTVALAVTQADLSFRLILEMRNRLSDALQEITRMQV
jgi:flagellar hook-basal body complex protein FliE